MSQFFDNGHFHTDQRPLDSKGQALLPLDLVIILDVPSQEYREVGLESIQSYSGCYGLITYCDNQPYYTSDKSVAGWTNRDGSLVHVVTRRIESGAVLSWDFWLPPQSLRQIPYNYLIMGLFADYPWEMPAGNDGSSIHFVIDGMQQFDYIKRIFDTPYEKLVVAHDLAIDSLRHT